MNMKAACLVLVMEGCSGNITSTSNALELGRMISCCCFSSSVFEVCSCGVMDRPVMEDWSDSTDGAPVEVNDALQDMVCLSKGNVKVEEKSLTTELSVSGFMLIGR